MTSSAELVLNEAKRSPEGTPLTAKGLLRLGLGRAAADQALSRLARSGRLLRISRGLYALPVVGRFGERPPSAVSVAVGLALATNEAVVPSGGSEANRLGLSTQVPVRAVFLTAGRAREIRLGAHRVEIRRVPRWQTILPGRAAGAAVRAMAWNGEREGRRTAFALRALLPAEEWETLLGVAPALPGWMAEALGREASAVIAPENVAGRRA